MLTAVGLRSPFSVVDVIVYPASQPVYDVELDYAKSVEFLVKEFFKFTRRKDPLVRPTELERVSLFHSVTAGTRIRISLLRVRSLYLYLLFSVFLCLSSVQLLVCQIADLS